MKRSPSRQLAVGSLLGITAVIGFFSAVAIISLPNYPFLVLAVLHLNLGLAIMFLPLLWWGHRYGGVGALIVGIVTIIQAALTFRVVLMGGFVVETLIPESLVVILSLILIASGRAASKETSF